MNKTHKRLLCIILCLLMIVSPGIIAVPKAIEPVQKVEIAGVNSGAVAVSWSEVEDAWGYRLYRYSLSEKKWTAIKTTGALRYTDTTVEPCETYYYSVRSYHYVNKKAVFSSLSKTAKVVVPPEQVTGLKQISETATSVTVSWNKQSKATGYLVYMYSPEARKFLKQATVGSNSYTVTGLEYGKSYKIAVKAYKKSGSYAYGKFSEILIAQTKGPEAPTNLKGAVNTDSLINLSWMSVPGSSGYCVYYYNSAKGAWEYLGSTRKTSYTVKGISTTAAYTYAVTSYVTVNGKNIYSPKSDSVTVYYVKESEKDDIYSGDLAKNGILGYLYDPAEKCFYTAADPWQRAIGYNAIFDILAPFTLIDFDTIRLYFEHGEKDWLVQLWKGQYGLAFYGAEVGVYNKPKDRGIAHYSCATDEEMLKMEMTFCERTGSIVTGKKWTERFTRPYGYYWWCTGFLPGIRYNRYDDMRLDMRITMRDYSMLDGFTKALEDNNIRYTLKGLDVYFSYE